MALVVLVNLFVVDDLQKKKNGEQVRQVGVGIILTNIEKVWE